MTARSPTLADIGCIEPCHWSALARMAWWTTMGLPSCTVPVVDHGFADFNAYVRTTAPSRRATASSQDCRDPALREVGLVRHPGGEDHGRPVALGGQAHPRLEVRPAGGPLTAGWTGPPRPPG